jgi:hypothetical protein
MAGGDAAVRGDGSCPSCCGCSSFRLFTAKYQIAAPITATSAIIQDKLFLLTMNHLMSALQKLTFLTLDERRGSAGRSCQKFKVSWQELHRIKLEIFSIKTSTLDFNDFDCDMRKPFTHDSCRLTSRSFSHSNSSTEHVLMRRSCTDNATLGKMFTGNNRRTHYE